ncbi:MAG TPA: DNA repair protein RadC [Fluviicola sp.]|nr:DNA repair protein RadC [Fluviicola sp.]
MLKESVAITSWAEEDRPREKMMSKGKNALSDAELLAILIGTGSGKNTAVDLGRSLLQLCNGDLYELGRLRLSQLCSVKGIGRTKAIKLMAALELGRRRKDQQATKKQVIASAQDGYNLIKSYFSDLEHEEFHIILLNRSNGLLGVQQISKGGLAGTYVDPKIIFKIAIDMGASGIMLAHNHPSGNNSPSLSDHQLTRKLVQFGKLIEMPVVDHLIISDNGYFSFSDNGLL